MDISTNICIELTKEEAEALRYELGEQSASDGPVYDLFTLLADELDEEDD